MGRLDRVFYVSRLVYLLLLPLDLCGYLISEFISLLVNLRPSVSGSVLLSTRSGFVYYLLLYFVSLVSVSSLVSC